MEKINISFTTPDEFGYALCIKIDCHGTHHRHGWGVKNQSSLKTIKADHNQAAVVHVEIDVKIAVTCCPGRFENG